MGMISTFIKQEIKVRDLSLTKDYLAFEKLSKDEVFGKIINVEYQCVEFEGLDGYKIESYWYDDMVVFLKKLAKFIEGYAEFSYEDDYKFRIVFKDGKPYRQVEKEIIFSNPEELK